MERSVPLRFGLSPYCTIVIFVANIYETNTSRPSVHALRRNFNWGVAGKDTVFRGDGRKGCIEVAGEHTKGPSTVRSIRRFSRKGCIEVAGEHTKGPSTVRSYRRFSRRGCIEVAGERTIGEITGHE